MNFISDISQLPMAWTSVSFLLSGVLLLTGVLLQSRLWRANLAADQFGMLATRQGATPLAMSRQMSWQRARDGVDEMQVVEGEVID